MKRSIILTFTALVSSASYAKTGSFSAFLNRLAPAAPVQLESDCTDFSGKWKGQCEFVTPSGSSTEEAVIEVAQAGCHQLAINDESYVLGTLYSQDQHFFANGKYGFRSIHPSSLDSYSIDWNDRKSEILIAGSYTSYPAKESDGLIVVPMVAGLFMKADGGLRQYLTLKEFLNVSCDYVKD